jgi:hypothetical protein
MGVASYCHVHKHAHHPDDRCPWCSPFRRDYAPVFETGVDQDGFWMRQHGATYRPGPCHACGEPGALKYCRRCGQLQLCWWSRRLSLSEMRYVGWVVGTYIHIPSPGAKPRPPTPDEVARVAAKLWQTQANPLTGRGE